MTVSTKRRARTQAKPERVRDAPRAAMVPIWDWRASNPHIFPTDMSLRWHLRRHRVAYIAAGALLKLAGRFVIDPPKFEETMRRVGQQVAERGSELEAA